MFSVLSPERRVPQDHPLRPIKAMAGAVLLSMSKRFDRMYSATGRPSIPPERLLKAQILMALYSVRSDRMFCEQLDYNLLFRWFLDMNADDPAFDHSTFTKNRDRLLEHDIAREFFAAVVEEARVRGLMSSEHFTVDGTLIEAMASLKTFRPKGEKPSDREPPDDPGNPTVNFHGEKRSNETHVSTTDPEARLARKSNNHEAKMAFSGHALMENRNGLLGQIELVVALDLRVDELALRGGGHEPREHVGRDAAIDVVGRRAVVAHVQIAEHGVVADLRDARARDGGHLEHGDRQCKAHARS